jgi:hypothetical protein
MNLRALIARLRPGRHSISRVRRSQLPVERTPDVIKALSDYLTPALSRTYLANSEIDIKELWSSHKLMYMYTPNLDRYAQVCVLGLRQRRSLPIVDSSGLGVEHLVHSPFLIASLGGTTRRYEFGIQPNRPKAPQKVFLAAPSSFDALPTWHATLSNARLILSRFGRPIIVSSLGYSFSQGDFEGTQVLRGVPHVVISISDFKYLWLRLLDEGLAGSRIIEYMPMPSTISGSKFGFLVLKPADKSFPIILNPCVVCYWKRIVGAVDDLKSPNVRLVQAEQHAQAWLGLRMKQAVETAAIVFDHGPFLPLGQTQWFSAASAAEMKGA